MGRTIQWMAVAACVLVAACSDSDGTFVADSGTDGGSDVGADAAADAGPATPARMGFGCDTVADCEYETACVDGTCSPCETSMDCGFQRMCREGICTVLECEISEDCDVESGEWCTWPGLTHPARADIEGGNAPRSLCTQTPGCDFEWLESCSATGEGRPFCTGGPDEPVSADCPDPQSRFWAE